ncbi:MAG: helix-turn-helix domain-containing protein [Pirellulales bacterium]|nr:helix-turn-helix domain-containing protein [Pirellulales bacterium]
MDTRKRLIPVTEVAVLLGVSIRTVWRMTSEGELPAPVKLSTRVTRWRLSDIEECIDNAQPVA